MEGVDTHLETLDGRETELSATEIGDLRDRIDGQTIFPTHPEYDEARTVWNGMIDRRPGLIARCESVDDVRSAVRFAARHDLLLAVRGGGHSVAGHGVCDDGLVVDCSPMRDVEVDPDARIARVGPGATWADVDGAAGEHGLAVPGGLVSSTGVAGLTLGGGFGWLSRAHGLTCDNLVSADVVTPGGDLIRAGREEHPELFWALRGGGWNFGVVVSFEFRLHPVSEVFAGPVLHRLDDAPDVLREYREIVSDAPDELTCYLLFRHAPPAPAVPDDARGEPALALVVFWCGDPERGAEATRPLRALGDPLADLVQRRPYTEWQQFSDESWEPGYRDYWKADYLEGLSDGALATLVEFGRSLPTSLSDFKVAHFEGTVARPPDGGTAFPHRDAPFVLNINTRWEEPAADEGHIAWTREFHRAMHPHTTGGTYVNFLGDEGEGRVRSAYGDAYERLAAVKRRYDPNNRFRMNQNVEPAP